VIDVLRAFTTAAYAFHQGVKDIFLAGTVEEALGLRERFPGSLCMGEVNGVRPPGFDFGNSPADLEGRELSGLRLIHRTTAGTQGAVRSVGAQTLLAASFVVASATARVISARQPAETCFVITGRGGAFEGDEDLSCAEFISALLRGEQPNPAPYLARVRASGAGRQFIYGPGEDFSAADLDYASALDRFHFALHIQRENGLLVMRALR
jgi:2-phosphosulfolactate phosphatase